MASNRSLEVFWLSSESLLPVPGAGMVVRAPATNSAVRDTYLSSSLLFTSDPAGRPIESAVP
jgi:hypothetical protein